MGSRHSSTPARRAPGGSTLSAAAPVEQGAVLDDPLPRLDLEPGPPHRHTSSELEARGDEVASPVTGGTLDHGKSIHRSVRRQTYSHEITEVGF